jgi:hypothetical protein
MLAILHLLRMFIADPVQVAPAAKGGALDLCNESLEILG